MKKEEFIKELREKLEILDQSEIDDIIEEYTGYIAEKIQNGASEEEAIQDFGDIDELATELLKAYKINVKKPKDKNWLTIMADTFLLWIDRIVKVFSNKTGSEILKILFEIILICFGIGLCKIPFHFLEELGYNVFSVFQSAFGLWLYKIWKFIIEFAYLIFAIVLFAKIFEKRYINTSEEPIKIVKEEKKPQKVQKKSEPIIEEKVEHTSSKRGILDVLSTICVWFVKFILLWILIAVAGCILGMGVCVGLCVFLLVKGVTYYGIYASIILLLFLGVLVFIIIFNFIFDKKNNVQGLLISFIVIFILSGISFSYASVEIATTKYINDLPNNYEKETLTETIKMDDKMILMGSHDYIADETLVDEIKVVYEYYPSYYTIVTDIEYKSQNRVYLDYDYISGQWNNQVINDVINDLKEKQIHNYSMIPKITVYTSSANIQKLQDNKSIWLDSKKYSERTYAYEACERELARFGKEELSKYCQFILYENDEL